MTYLKPRNPTGAGGYKKGVSGNPNGRPMHFLAPIYREKLDEIDYTTGKSRLITLFEALYEEARDEKSVQAFNAIMNRAFGRPVVTKDINVTENLEHKVYRQLVIITEELKTEDPKELSLDAGSPPTMAELVGKNEESPGVVTPELPPEEPPSEKESPEPEP